jgi:hypothetical protein
VSKSVTHPHRKFVIGKVHGLASEAVVPEPGDSSFLEEEIKAEHRLQQVVNDDRLSQPVWLAVLHEFRQKYLQYIYLNCISEF